MGNTTALSYQMMYEQQWSSAMINAEMRGAMQTACEYAIILLVFIGVQDNSLPPQPVGAKTQQESFKFWQDYYFKLLRMLGKKISANLATIRATYRDKNSDIPDVVDSKK